MTSGLTNDQRTNLAGAGNTGEIGGRRSLRDEEGKADHVGEKSHFWILG